MMGETTVRFCKICNHDTEHLQGNFKSREDENGELFFLDVTTSQALKKVSRDFSSFVEGERGGMMNGEAVEGWVGGGGLDFGLLFARVVRSLKCGDCGHLIKLSRLP